MTSSTPPSLVDRHLADRALTGTRERSKVHMTHDEGVLDGPRLGIDIGRVIIDGSGHPSGSDTAFFEGGLDNAMRTPAVPGAFETIARLTNRFDGRVWLVSKCGERVEARTRAWLDRHDFFNRTGVNRAHLRFCRQRPDKAIHCAELAITHFIDDRLDVLHALAGIVEHRYQFGASTATQTPDILPVATWEQAEHAITAAFDAGDKPLA